jgi:hypothetical protein
MNKAQTIRASADFRRGLHPDLRADYVLANGSMSSNQNDETRLD